MTVKKILFDEVDFEELMAVRVKRERSVFFHLSKPLVYKIYAEDWEFADRPVQGFEYGVYNEKLVPNIVGFIVDGQQRNRGYVMQKVSRGRILDNIHLPLFSLRAVMKIAGGEIKWHEVIWRRYRLNKDYFVDLLHSLISSSYYSGWMFAEFTLPNLWMDKKGYHLLDLDALRECKWLFEQDRKDPEFIRKLVNRQHLNRDIKNLIESHGLIAPSRIVSQADCGRFWEDFIRINNVTNEGLVMLKEPLF